MKFMNIGQLFRKKECRVRKYMDGSTLACLLARLVTCSFTHSLSLSLCLLHTHTQSMVVFISLFLFPPFKEGK
jgi:hypothetical protein